MYAYISRKRRLNVLYYRQKETHLQVENYRHTGVYVASIIGIEAGVCMSRITESKASNFQYNRQKFKRLLACIIGRNSAVCMSFIIGIQVGVYISIL
jgi:hypothetical protein